MRRSRASRDAPRRTHRGGRRGAPQRPPQGHSPWANAAGTPSFPCACRPYATFWRQERPDLRLAKMPLFCWLLVKSRKVKQSLGLELLFHLFFWHAGPAVLPARRAAIGASCRLALPSCDPHRPRGVRGHGVARALRAPAARAAEASPRWLEETMIATSCSSPATTAWCVSSKTLRVSAAARAG